MAFYTPLEPPSFVKGSFVFCLLSVLTFLLGFVSPYWLQSWPSVHSHFIRLGLWEVCFSNFRHPNDYEILRVHNGCQFMLSSDLYWFREWLLPGWFVTTIIFCILALVLIMVSTAVQSYLFVICNRPTPPESVLAYVGTISVSLASLCMFISVMCFGIGRNTWEWIFRAPDTTHLSWSYGFVVFSMGCSAVSACLIFIYARKLYEQKRAGMVKGPPIGFQPAPAPYRGGFTGETYA